MEKIRKKNKIREFKIEETEVKMTLTKTYSSETLPLKKKRLLMVQIYTRQKLLGVYENEFEFNCDFITSDHLRETQIRIEKIRDFDKYINTIDMDYDLDDSVLLVLFIN